MLEEATRLTPNSQWKKVKSIFQKDDRYQAIDSSSLREEYFEEYVKQLGKARRANTRLYSDCVYVCVHACICIRVLYRISTREGWLVGVAV